MVYSKIDKKSPFIDFKPHQHTKILSRNKGDVDTVIKDTIEAEVIEEAKENYESFNDGEQTISVSLYSSSA